MKKSIILLLILTFLMFSSLFAFNAPFAINDELEKEAIKKVIVSSYIEGIFLKGDPDMVKKGWYYDCDIVTFDPNRKQIRKLPALFWADRFEKRPGPLDENISYEFSEIIVKDYAAVAFVNVYNKDKSKLIYNDIMSLYKFADGWKIVTKIYYGTPRNGTEAKEGSADDKEAVKKAIFDGYIDGIFLKGDPALVKKGWHYDCDIVIFDPNRKAVRKIPAYYWVDRLEKKPGPLSEDISYEFKKVFVKDYAAFAVVEVYNKDKSKHIYTDLMSLYKFDDGWKVATKIYYASPGK